MQYIKLDFGKHDGLTIPAILFKDADWFYWAYEQKLFVRDETLKAEADDLYSKSRKIKIPPENGLDRIAEYMPPGAMSKRSGKSSPESS
jgi:hypothetical protein